MYVQEFIFPLSKVLMSYVVLKQGETIELHKLLIVVTANWEMGNEALEICNYVW